MDYLSGKGSAQTAADAFRSIANEAIASGKLTAQEATALKGALGQAKVYVDAMGLVGDNGIGRIIANTAGELNWDKVVSNKGETRIDHINRHATPNPRRVSHGVFNGDPQTMVNDAWRNRGDITPIEDGVGGTIYNIPYKNAGYESGYNNTGQQMDYITIIVVTGTSDIISAFPSFGNYAK